MSSSDPRPGSFHTTATQAGNHLVLKAANGETVITSEVYTDPDTSVEALALILQTSADILRRPISRSMALDIARDHLDKPPESA